MKTKLFVIFLFALTLQAQDYNWPAKPFNQQHGINGTFCENRPSSDIQRHHFHDGVDIALADGGEVYSILSTKVTSLNPSGGNSYIRIGRYAYVHVTPNPSLDVGDAITAFQTVIGATNYKNHIHFKDGYPGSEINAIRDGGGLSPLQDSFVPTVATIRFYLNGTSQRFNDNRVSGLVDIISQAYDRTNEGYSGSNNGIYRMGYQIYDSVGITPLSSLLIPFKFDQIPASDAYITNVYFKGSDLSTYIYTPTNKISGDGYWDTRSYAPGSYQVMIEVEDTRHNITRRFQKVTVVAQDAEPPAIPRLLTFVGNASGDWDLSWLPNESDDLSGYNLEFSYDAQTWNTNLALSQNLSASDTIVHYTGFPNHRLFFLRLSAYDDAALINTSLSSKPLGLMLKPQEPMVLLMDQALNKQLPNKQFIPTWGGYLAVLDTSFNSATSDALQRPTFKPEAYPLWMLNINESLSDLLAGRARQKIDSYLNGGGMLVLSAPHLAQEAQNAGGDSLRNWQLTYHTDYAGPVVEADSLRGEPGTIFEGFRAVIDTTGISGFLTALAPAGRFSEILIRFNDTAKSGAAIYKPRWIGNIPHNSSRLVYSAFPIQNIQGEAMRQDFLKRIIRMQSDSSRHVPIVNIPPTVEAENELIIGAPFPNPANGHFQIRIYLPVDMNVVFDLLNIQGRIVKKIFQAHLVGGWQKVQIKTNGLASGLYILRIEAGKQSKQIKMLLIK